MPKFMTTFTIGLLLFSTASEASIRVQLERIDPSVSQCIKAMEKVLACQKHREMPVTSQLTTGSTMTKNYLGFPLGQQVLDVVHRSLNSWCAKNNPTFDTRRSYLRANKYLHTSCVSSLNSASICAGLLSIFRRCKTCTALSQNQPYTFCGAGA